MDKVVHSDTQALPVVPAAIAPYCVNTYTTAVEPLTLVKINEINNISPAATGGTQHEDFTAVLGTLRPGATYAVTMKANTDGAFAHGFALYVDWNQDGLLTGANEGYWIGTVTGSTGTDALSAIAYITVPADAVLGDTRLRAMTAYNITALSGLPPCRTGAGYGQSEDYTVTISTTAAVPTLPLSVSASFTPTSGAVPTSTTLAITLGNINTAATPTTADFTTTLPAGMTLAANATTTCPGTFTGASGGNAITLASGASIPVGGCAISANVAVAAGGNYAVTAGPITTAEGSASAVAKFFGWGTTPSTSYNVGFEAPDYSVAAINGQQGWSARTSNVVTTTPATGAQHFSQTGLAAPTTANNPLAISSNFPVGTTRYAAVSANLRISRTTNGASWQFQPQDPDAGLLSTIVRFNRTGNAIETFSWSGGSGTAVSTGATFTPDTYFNFKLLIDRATSNVRLCKDGVQIFESTDGTGTTGGNNVASMVFQQATGTGQTANNTFFADDLNVSYTPSYNCDGSMPAHTVTPSVTGNGSISPNTAQTVNDGATTAFTLAATSGNHLVDVTGTCGGTLASNVFTTNVVTADCTVIANFAVDAPVTFTVTPSVGTGTGTISPSTPQTVNSGATTSFNLSAGSGFTIGTVGGTCGGSLVGSTYTTAAATANCTVVANFVASTGDPNIVCSAPINHLIVNNIDGTSVNWLTGSIVDGDIPGNHFNPYGGNTGNLLFYWAATGTQAGGVAATATGPYQVLATGAVIGASSTFTQVANGANNETAAFLAGVDGYLGFRFMNTGTSQLNYGYVRLQTTAPTGFPAKIVDYCYNNAGASITIAGGTPVTTPSVSKAFAPASVLIGANSTATVTLTNPNATAATLSAALVDTLPAGLTASAASTTCAGGTASFTAGTFTLSTGATIPANGSCTVSATVSSAAAGPYVNTIAAGALQTSAGNNAAAASATLTVTTSGPAFPAPYCAVTFPSNVEPISRVVFTGIANPSSPTLNGSPALENFLSVSGGAVVAGLTYPIAVEGNTDGSFTNKVNVFIDWNQNGTFEANEGVLLSDLVNSTGADGQQATGNIVVPPTALSGTTRMRVLKKWSTEATPCNSAGYGQAEDYQITVTGESGSPIVNVNPAAGFEFTVDAGATGTDTLVIGNTGTATLTYNIQRALDARPAAALATKWEAQRRANEALRKEPWATPASMGRSVAMRSDAIARPFELLAEDISQMASNTPEALNGVGCGSAAAGASNNSWWRRFYFNEHSISGAATINSVTVASETGVSTPVTVRVYTIPSSVAVDTIPTAQLTLIGSGTGTVGGDLTTTTVAISPAATVDDTAGKNLVVEYHIDGGAGLPRFFPGGNPSAQTHKTFISSPDCSIAEPVTSDSINFPDFHIIMVVNVDTGPAGVGCDAPSNVPWLSVTPASGTVSPSSSANVSVTVNAGSLAAGTYEGLMCVNSNDPVNPRIEVPVSMTVEVNDTIFKDGFDGSSAGACEPAQLFQDSSFEATTGEGGPNTFWNSDSTTGDSVFWSSGQVRTGTYAVWLGGYGGGAAETMHAEQAVTFTGSQRYLNFWRMNARQGGGVSTVKFLVDGTVVHTDSTLALPVDAAFVKQTIDLSAYANGQSHTVRIQYDHNGTGQDANYFLDDITLDCTAGRPAN